MGLFGNKKKADGFRTLTEKEIQNKLYGRYTRTESSTVVEDRPREIPPAARKITPGVAANETQTDLFKSRPSIDSFIPPPFVRPSSPGLSQESKKSSSPASLPVEPKSASSFKVAPVETKQKINVWAGVGKSALKIVAGAGGAILWGVRSAAAAILNAINSTDFNNPRTRKTLYGLGGFSFLLILFVGTHFLNVKREIVMKQPRKVTAPAPKPIVIPKDGVLSAPDTPSDEESPVVAVSEASAPAVEETEAAEPALKTGITKDRPYAIQVATFASRPDAQKLAEKILATGLPAFARPVSRTGGKTYFCVLIGGYPVAKEAGMALYEFKKKEISTPFRDAFVRTFEA